jgi:hypothetical protein
MPVESGRVWAEDERDAPSKSTMEMKQVRSRCQVMMQDLLLSTVYIPYAWALAVCSLSLSASTRGVPQFSSALYQQACDGEWMQSGGVQGILTEDS